MMMFRKCTACALSVAIMAIAAGSLSVGAMQVVNSDAKATFCWGYGWSQMYNDSTSNRYATATVQVYNNVTGAHVTTASDNGIIGFGEYIPVSTAYVSNSYNWTCRGSIFNGTSSYSNVDWSPLYHLAHT